MQVHRPFLEVYLSIFILFLENHYLPKETMSYLALAKYEKSKGSHLTMHVMWNLSLSGIMTEPGRFILFPFKIILTSFQSNSITSQSIFLFNLTCSGVNFL